MIAKLWTKKIIAGEKTFAEVPARLKSQVKELLIEAGRPDLITE